MSGQLLSIWWNMFPASSGRCSVFGVERKTTRCNGEGAEKGVKACKGVPSGPLVKSFWKFSGQKKERIDDDYHHHCRRHTWRVASASRASPHGKMT